MQMQSSQPEEQPSTMPPATRNLVLGFGALAVVLAAVALATFEYAQHQRRQMEDLAATNRSLNASMTQVQEQLQSVTDRLTQRIEAENGVRNAPPAVEARAARKAAAPKRVAVVSPPPKDPRVDVLEGRLADQQKALASTREDLDQTRGDLGKTRDELSGKIDSNRDELNGSLGRTRDDLNTSIAHTHDELVELQKRGERNYFEFSLNKNAKDFQKVGPVSLELRKVDYKHKSYDLSMLVEDFTLQKKKVNLYEPVWITLTDAQEPVQLIVNQIDKDKIAGYISAPKYRKSELARTASNAVETQAAR